MAGRFAAVSLGARLAWLAGGTLTTGAFATPAHAGTGPKTIPRTAKTREQKAKDEQIDGLITKAIDLRRLGRDKDALVELQRAADIERQPRVAAQIGVAEQALGLWVFAERDLKEGLDHANDPWIKEHRSTLDEAMTFIVNHLAHLDVWGPPDGAQVSLDGELIGTLPFTTPLPVPVGNPEMTVKASGFATVSRPLEIKARSNLREHVVMRPLQLAPAPALTAGPQAAPSPAPGITPAPPNSPQAAPVAPHEESSSIFGHWWFWTAAGVVLAGAGVGTYLALHRSNDCISSATNTCTTLTP